MQTVARIAVFISPVGSRALFFQGDMVEQTGKEIAMDINFTLHCYISVLLEVAVEVGVFLEPLWRMCVCVCVYQLNTELVACGQ